MPFCPTCQTQCEEGVPICPVDGTPLIPRDLIGRVLGDRYRILERMGEGGMGTVYLCEHVALGRRMALKLLRPEFCSDDDLIRRFQQEAQAASLIGQENIVDVIDFGRTPEGSLYFVMEALEGESLASLLHREKVLPPRRALPILGQICRALAAAHARGVVHRDLKPDNVFLIERNGEADFVKVLDFGISKYGAMPENLRITRAGSIIGTPEYMAPEQAAATAVDHRCDIYAFGVLAYEMLTGTLPFQGETALATLIKHQSEPPERPTRRNPELPPAVERFILKALVKCPEGRQQSMAEVAAGLSQALRAVGLRPVRTTTFGAALLRRATLTTDRFAPALWQKRPMLPSGQTVTLDGLEITEVKPRRWLRRLAVVSAAAAVAAAVFISWQWQQGRWLSPVMPLMKLVGVTPQTQQSAVQPVASEELTPPPPPAAAPPPPPRALELAPAVPVEPAPVVAEPKGAMAGETAGAEQSRIHSRLERQRNNGPPALGRRSTTRRKNVEPGKVDELKPDPF